MNRHKVVVVGGGFGGLSVVSALKGSHTDVLLVDASNFHLFQPLLYQVATGSLSPAEIAAPLRGVFNRRKEVTVWQAEAVDLDPARKVLLMSDEVVQYDTLVVATGVRHSYFGHPEWEEEAPGLKRLEDALEMRRRIFSAFEFAEREDDPELRKAWMTFAIIGGGPTGVELAGALAELTSTLRHDFRSIDPKSARIILIESGDRVLGTYHPELSERAKNDLEKMGIEVLVDTRATAIEHGRLTLKTKQGESELRAKTVLWAAGVQASTFAQVLKSRLDAPLDRAGRVKVEPDLTVPGHPSVFVIGDLAALEIDGKPLPGVAPVAMQEGEYVARIITDRLAGRKFNPKPFRYRDRGSLAVIGRNKAVLESGRFRLSGFPAWLVWAGIHIRELVNFESRIVVFFRWALNYWTNKRGARLITEFERLDARERPKLEPDGIEKPEPSLSRSTVSSPRDGEQRERVH